MYNPTKWQDHITDPQNEYIIEPVEGDRYKITPYGEILKRGTLLSAENFNKTELALFETVAMLGSMFQNLQLQKDDIEYNYSELMKQKIELENQKNKLDANYFFVTEEKTKDMTQGYEMEEALINSIFVDFDKKNFRKNTNYVAIPIITYTKIKNDTSGCNKYHEAPLIHISTKREDGCTVEVCRMDPLSPLQIIKFVVLVIGGV